MAPTEATMDVDMKDINSPTTETETEVPKKDVDTVTTEGIILFEIYYLNLHSSARIIIKYQYRYFKIRKFFAFSIYRHP